MGTSEDTSFKARWNRFAAARGLGDDPRGVVPSATVELLRRDALEFFSWGSVDGVRYQWRVDDLIPVENWGELMRREIARFRARAAELGVVALTTGPVDPVKSKPERPPELPGQLKLFRGS